MWGLRFRYNDDDNGDGYDNSVMMMMMMILTDDDGDDDDDDDDKASKPIDFRTHLINSSITMVLLWRSMVQPCGR